jgi:hypothetical protein
MIILYIVGGILLLVVIGVFILALPDLVRLWRIKSM